MPDVTVKSLDELDNYEGRFLYAGKSVGVTAWGMNVVRMPANWDGYPEHDHAEDGQEEAYVLLEGSATLHAGGEIWELAPGVIARVGPQQTRKIVPGGEGATMLALGGTPGEPYPARE